MGCPRDRQERLSALIYCPFPDRETALAVGGQLVDEKLVACINVGGPISALFAWNGEKGEGEEVAALLKTDSGLLDAAIERLDCLHPYVTPAILGWPCHASAGTQEWLAGLNEGGKSDGS
ncbi:MAG: divalent-cation tolerance protein CutA [Erythrobacter sp.]|nr:divalent-cation tolerance protein CutA [Erythrobacter sp.]